jgi:hypothetical protein
MYKGRLGLWILSVIICLIVSLGVKWIPTWFETTDLNISISIDGDADFSQVVANEKINGIKMYVRDDDPDVIITSNTLANTENYKVYDDILYSPLVMYACGIYNNDDGFISVAGSSNKYKVDLYAILTAMESGKDWESIGFHKNVANGKITLYIPNEQCAYYNDVVELFYLTLNNGKTPDEATREALRPRVNTILSQCNTVSDIAQAIADEYSDPSKTHKVFIGPEYLYRRHVGSSIGSGSDSTKQFRHVYFLNTVYLTADIYVSKADEDIQIGEQFIEKIKTKKHFMQQTGWRIKNSTFDLDDVGWIYIETP